MILKWDDGASGVLPTCFSMPASQPSILSWHVAEARAGEHDLEHDGRHAPADVFSFRFFACGDFMVRVCRENMMIFGPSFMPSLHAAPPTTVHADLGPWRFLTVSVF